MFTVIQRWNKITVNFFGVSVANKYRRYHLSKMHLC